MRKMFFLAIITLCAGTALALTNPGFETGDLTGWTTYGSQWNGTGVGDPAVPTNVKRGPIPFSSAMPTEGEFALMHAVNGVVESIQRGGIYQVVTDWAATTAVAKVDFTTSQSTDEWTGGRIGIDPTGGTDYTAGSVVWSSIVSCQKDNAWSQASVAVTGITPGSNVSVFVEYIYGLVYTSGWLIVNADNVRLEPLDDNALPKNLGLEKNSPSYYQDWLTLRPRDLFLIGDTPGGARHTYGLVNALIEESGFHPNIHPVEGNLFNETVAQYDRDKDTMLAQRFSTGGASKLRVGLWINTVGNYNSMMEPITNPLYFIGIDPTGGVNPNAGTVQWITDGQSANNGWAQITEEINLTGSTVTIFIERWHRWGEYWTRSAFDDIWLWFDGTRYYENIPFIPTSNVPHWSVFE